MTRQTRKGRNPVNPPWGRSLKWAQSRKSLRRPSKKRGRNGKRSWAHPQGKFMLLPFHTFWNTNLKDLYFYPPFSDDDDKRSKSSSSHNKDNKKSSTDNSGPIITNFTSRYRRDSFWKRLLFVIRGFSQRVIFFGQNITN